MALGHGTEIAIIAPIAVFKGQNQHQEVLDAALASASLHRFSSDLIVDVYENGKWAFNLE